MLNPTFYIPNSRNGFTLIELLLSVAALSILLGIGIPVYQKFQNRTDLETTAFIFAESLRRAETLSKGISYDSPWGVYATTSKVILFRGGSYLGRNKAFDEEFNISPSISITGMNEFVFAKFTGTPQITGTLTLTSINNETRNISVNQKGTIIY